MAYQQNNKTGEIVINGFENGIGDSPYKGLTDMRCVNVISIPGEAGVQFSTIQDSFIPATGSVVSANAGTDTVTFTSSQQLTAGMAVTFTGASLPTGIVAGTLYWIGTVDNGAGTFIVYTDFSISSVLNITATGTGTFATVNMGVPQDSCSDMSGGNYIVDGNGRAWKFASSNWRFLGNTTTTNGNGNGIIWYRGYLFIFRNGVIDYMVSSSFSWTYAWQSMNTTVGTNNPHYALVGQDDVVYYPDSNYIGSFFQKAGMTFDPSNAATYTFAIQALILVSNIRAQCLAELGINLLIGTSGQTIFPWDRTSTGAKYPILIADTNIVRMQTVNTNTFIFAGNRGRIYYTNGSQAQLYKKVPDHLSTTIEPYYTWGGVGFTKNQLLFGVSATTNAAVNINQYGGLWAIDLDTKALRLINKLSYGTYAGRATVIIPISGVSGGLGLYIGWNNDLTQLTAGGMDETQGVPYNGGQSTIISDLIPVGTFLTKMTYSNVEFKLSAPLVAGESVQLLIGSTTSEGVNASFVSLGTESTVGSISAVFPITVQTEQWLKIQAILTGTSTNPSYVRLTELRIRI